MFVSELERIWKEICATWVPLKQHQQGVLLVPEWNQDDQDDFFQPGVWQSHFFYKRKVVYCFKRTRVRLLGRRGWSDLQDFSEKLLRKAEGEKAHIAP